MKVYDIISEINSNRINEASAGPLKTIGRVLGIGKTSASEYRSALRAIQQRYPVTGLKGKARFNMLAKRAAENAKARAAAEAVVNGSSVISVLKVLGIVYILYDYWTESNHIEDEYKEYLEAFKSKKQPDKNNYFYSVATPEEAYELAQQARELALGKATSLILLSTGYLSKFIKGFGTIVQWMLGGKFVPGARLVALPIKALGSLISLAENPVTMAALAAFFATEQGKSLLYNSTTMMITSMTGKVSAVAIDNVVAALNALGEFITEKYPKLAKKLGIDKGLITKPSERLPPPVTGRSPEAQAQAEKEKAQQTDINIPAELRSKTVGNTLYVGGVQITDNNGKMLPGNLGALKDIDRMAKDVGIASPVAHIPH